MAYAGAVYWRRTGQFQALRVVRVLVVLGAVLTASVMPAASVPGGHVTAGAEEPGVRYLDHVFAEVDSQFDVVYGESMDDGILTDLKMDVYQPRGDTLERRPLLIWIHGGTFVTGDKSSHRDEAADFARRGYVSATINYRLAEGAHWEGTSLSDVLSDWDFIAAVYEAFKDADQALQYFHDHADEWGIDPDRMSVAGYSAGAVTAINTGVMHERQKGNGVAPTDTSAVTGAVVSFAGLTTMLFPERGEPDILMLHGTKDKTVYYDEAVNFCNGANSRGVYCELHSFVGGAHGIISDWNILRDETAQFLYDHDIDPSPWIERVAPNTGPISGGYRIEVIGRNFTGLDTVTINGVATDFTVVDDYHLWATVPPIANPWLVHVRVTNHRGSSPTGSWTYFGYRAPTPGQGSLSGQVRDHAGDPLPGATVHIARSDGTEEATATTAADGSWVLHHLPAVAAPDGYRVGVEAPAGRPDAPEWYLDAPSSDAATLVPVPDGGISSGIDVQLDAGTAAGTVVGAEGVPIEGAAVSIVDGEATVGTATSAADGTWELLVAPGSYTLEVTPPGHVEELHRDLAPGTTAGDAVVVTDGATTVVPVVAQPVCAPVPVFIDVGAPGAEASCGEIEWMASAGITTGFADGTFRPEQGLTRQALMAFLHRLAGTPEPPADAPTFTDVQANHPFAGAIAWAASMGITTGFADGTFRPATPVTRQAFAAFMHRLAGTPAGPHGPPLPADLAPTHPFFAELSWLSDGRYEALTWAPTWPDLMGDGTLSPSSAVVRRTVAAALYRLVAEGLVAPV